MRPTTALLRRWTRRALFSAAFASPLLADVEKGRIFPSEVRRFADPATELEVHRLTSADFSSRLPAYYLSAVTRRSDSLLYSSDRTGTWQAYRMDLKTGDSLQLTEAKLLNANSLTLMPDERSFCCVDGPSLRQVEFSRLREREIYRAPEGWELSTQASVSRDGLNAVFVETQGPNYRLRLLRFAQAGAVTLLDGSLPISDPQIRPKGAQILYRQAGEALWVVGPDGRGRQKLKTPPGKVGPAFWAPDGSKVLYLHYPQESGRLNAIREIDPGDNQDKMVSSTSQFVHFGANRDTSVFVGASRNMPSPHVLLLLRLTRREFTLCEHRSANPSDVSPIFSPNSQQIFFQSDKFGKPAIFRVRVDKLVEETAQ